MKKYKKEAYKGYLKFAKENRYQKIASITWLSADSLRVDLESPWLVSAKSKGRPVYFFSPKLNCVIYLTDAKKLGAKEIVYSALLRMNKELDEIGEKVEGRPQ